MKMSVKASVNWQDSSFESWNLLL